MKRNLIYYLYPRQSSMLALNLYMLHKYRSIFNGRKIIMATDDQGLIDMTHLCWMFNDTHDIRPYELIPVPATSGKFLSDCFFDLLSMIKSDDPEESSFFACAKGTSIEELDEHDIGELSDEIEIMYSDNLSKPDLVDEVLCRHPCAGTFKYVEDSWRYYGDFFWFNHARMFSRGWDIKRCGESVGSYLSRRFSYEDAYNLGGSRHLEVHGSKNRAKHKALFPTVRNFDPSKITIVTTCKNRWQFLKESLQTWVGKGFKEIIIVDWSSDVPVADEVDRFPKGENTVCVIRVRNERIFNGGMARNTGARQASGEYLLFVDSDMKIVNWDVCRFISMTPGRFYHGPHNIPPFGTCLVHVDDFRKVNGYSELYPAYGWEDNDLYNRLEDSGLRRCFFDERLVEHIDHSDELRALYRDQRGRKLHESVWDNRDKVEKWTTYHQQADKPHVRREFKI